MVRRSLYALVVYVFGAVGFLYWSLAGFNAGAPREDWTLMIVLPAAWIISFWPMFGTLVVIWKIQGLQKVLHRMADRIREQGAAEAADLAELEDLAVDLAAREHRLPQLLVRPLIRKAILKTTANRPESPARGTESGGRQHPAS